MKALTLRQPWATLVAVGAKTIETRSWGTRYRGPVVIHAAKTFSRPEVALTLEAPFSTVLRDHINYPRDLPLGAVIAVVDLVDVVRMDASEPSECPGLQGRELGEHEAAFGFYSPERFAWVLDIARPLREPVPARGALGLWEVEPNDFFPEDQTRSERTTDAT